MSTTEFPSLLQRFFVDRLVRQLGVSPHTVAGYRDTFRLLLHFADDRLGRAPSELKIDDLDATFLVKFLVYLEKERHVSVRTRNTRLAALHSFFRYVAFCEPALALQMPSSKHPIPANGLEGETTHCCSSLSKPACEIVRSSPLLAGMCNSAPARMCDVSAKAERRAAHHYNRSNSKSAR